MLGKELESFSWYSAPTWYCCAKREYWNVTLTLLAEISGALSCLTMAAVTISTAQSHRLIVDLNLEPDQMTLGATNTNQASSEDCKGIWSRKCLSRICSSCLDSCLFMQWISHECRIIRLVTVWKQCGGAWCWGGPRDFTPQKNERSGESTYEFDKLRRFSWIAWVMGMIWKVELSGLSVSPTFLFFTLRGASAFTDLLISFRLQDQSLWEPRRPIISQSSRECFSKTLSSFLLSLIVNRSG